MSGPAHLVIDPSQFPEAVRRDLLAGLESRNINQKFHYESRKQTQKWLRLHQEYSPAQTDPHCVAIYEKGFAVAAQRFGPGALQVIGLCCGGGQKDTALLRVLRDGRTDLTYLPCDASVPMVLVARDAALKFVPKNQCLPVVCDLGTATDLPGSIAATLASASKASNQRDEARCFTFFGTLHNFEPEFILPRLAHLLRPGDQLLLSANLAPETDYPGGLQRVLPHYDNALTRDWLMSFLLDLGVENGDGEPAFVIEESDAANGLKRITAYFRFVRDRLIQLDTYRTQFRTGESIRLFFSYRHQAGLLQNLLAQSGLNLTDEWITPSQEEGVFLVEKR